jgi:hypothetical protein
MISIEIPIRIPIEIQNEIPTKLISVETLR